VRYRYYIRYRQLENALRKYGVETRSANSLNFVSLRQDPIYLSKSDNDQDGTPTPVEQDEEDPCVIRDAMNRLNHEVVLCFVNLVDGLVQNPKEDMKEKREILSNNLINMHQEANKFREHQAREILIDILQRQVHERKEVLDELLGQIQKANDALESIPKS